MTKRVLIGLVMAMVVTGAGAADAKMLDAKKLKEIKASAKVLQNPTLKIKDGMDEGSVYFLRLEAKSRRGSRDIQAFVDKKTGAVYFGTGYHKDGKMMSFPKDPKIIKDGISFSYGRGVKELYLVTDPECPYCIKFEKEAEGKLDEYTVHVILYPLPFHKKAPAMVEWIMQGKSDAEKKERLSQIALKNSTEYKALITDEKEPFKYTPAIQEKMNKSIEAVKEIGARGTPVTFDASFTQVPWSKIVNPPAEADK
ncbi:MAG: thioredoxin fold domain-containing protein [Campylobacterota bacterium]|nr:thioredoxin fold domain-containing protein [Campylobacterota bacterium]